MRELGIAFDEKLIPFAGPGEPNAIRAFSPTGKVPCLIDGSTVVWDSMAIAEYLAERSSGVWAAHPGARAWSRSAAAEMHSGFSDLRHICGMHCGLRIRLHARPPGLLRDIARIDALWSEGLSRFGGPFLAGDAFTAVDAFYAPVAFRVQTYSLPLSAPALEYANRLLALPSMQEWYASALTEPWRDQEHEAVAMQMGVCLEDLRAR